MARTAPVIGLTTDVVADRFQVGAAYGDLIVRCGGVPLVLPACLEQVPRYLEICHGFVFTGGDDPDTRYWRVPLHPQARLISPRRQAFELALLEALDPRPERPVLGVCLGMQLMALHAGGAIDQYLPDTTPTAGEHYGRVLHAIEGELGGGMVQSHHRQAVSDPGRLRVVARAPDGVIEAVQDDSRGFYLGVQWHPERTGDEHLGTGLFRRLVAKAAE